jgi:hypothetical protein
MYQVFENINEVGISINKFFKANHGFFPVVKLVNNLDDSDNLFLSQESSNALLYSASTDFIKSASRIVN